MKIWQDWNRAMKVDYACWRQEIAASPQIHVSRRESFFAGWQRCFAGMWPVIVTIAIVCAAIGLVVGSTAAYWFWRHGP